MIKWTVRPSPYLYTDDWTGESAFGSFEVTRVSHTVLGTPWRVTYPNGNTLRVANADEGKAQAEQWLAQQKLKGGQPNREEKD